MCFNNKFKYRTWRVLLDNKKKQSKQKTKNKHSLKDCTD